MRAKLLLQSVTPFEQGQGENLAFFPVTEKPFDQDGNSEDNTFSKWTPSGKVELAVTNPNLIGKFTVGEKYYVDFTKADS